jgi:hypothetical protein
MAQLPAAYQQIKPFNKLPKKNKEFVKNYVKLGDVVEAYEKAGYVCKNPKALRARAQRLLKNMAPYLDDAMQQYIKGTDMAIYGIARVRWLAENAESDVVKLNAAKELLRHNLPDETVVNHVVHNEMSDEQMDKRIRELQDQLFEDAPRLAIVQ